VRIRIKPKEWTEKKVTDLLKLRYSGNAWAFLPKVRNGTGFQAIARTADALAMSLWPSRGLDVYGFEVKVYRADWLRELNNPQKAEEIFSFCDYWYIVTPPGIVVKEELPKTWGLLEIAGTVLRAKVEAPKLSPKPVDRLFLAALLRKVTENMAAEQQLEQAKKRGRDEGFEEGKEVSRREIAYAEEKQKAAEERIEEFERATGLRYDSWRPVAEVAQAVKIVLNGEDKRIVERLKRIREEIAGLLEECDKTITFKVNQQPEG
jgi:hypothetical protein